MDLRAEYDQLVKKYSDLNSAHDEKHAAFEGTDSRLKETQVELVRLFEVFECVSIFHRSLSYVLY